jgi:hypothetical protein
MKTKQSVWSSSVPAIDSGIATVLSFFPCSSSSDNKKKEKRQNGITRSALKGASPILSNFKVSYQTQNEPVINAYI